MVDKQPETRFDLAEFAAVMAQKFEALDHLQEATFQGLNELRLQSGRSPTSPDRSIDLETAYEQFQQSLARLKDSTS